MSSIISQNYQVKFLIDIAGNFVYICVILNQRGSHIQLIHPAKSGKVTVPHPKKELDPKTVKSIFKQASLDN